MSPSPDPCSASPPALCPLPSLGPGRVGVGVGAGVTLLLGLLGLTHVQSAQDAAVAREQALATHTALRLNDWLDSRLLVLDTVRLMRSRGLVDGAGDWRARVGADLEVVDGFQAVNWVSARGVIEITAPEAGNESALGRRVGDHPQAGPILAEVRSSGRSAATPPLDLFQGGRGFATYLPVRGTDGGLTGFVNGVFRVDAIVNQALNHLDTDAHHIRIADGDALLWTSERPGEDGAPTAQATVQVLDRSWQVAMTPTQPAVPRSTQALGLVLAVGVGLGAGLSAGWARRQAMASRAALLENLRLLRQVEEARRMEVLGQVAGGIAHDFNNLLTVVMSSAELVGANLSPDQQSQQEDIDAILDAGERGSRLIASLLSFARQGQDAVGEVDAVAHLGELSAMLQHVVGPQVDLKLDLPQGDGRIGLSQTALDRIIVNLINNAKEALPDGAGRVGLSIELDQDLLHIHVSDDGRGMAPEVRRRIFEPYFTTRAAGTGLGLATVFGLVHQAGGSIDVASAPGAGSRFTLSLPRLRTQG